ncbi:MAG: calcium/sodium antiporter [Rhizobiales bacterium]|nr:calcium/sodium antiporter [Hyphomicrobiales bacterium]
MVDYIYLIAGLAVLVVGGDILVKGAVGLAEKMQIPALIIGLTVVAFGTSAPELFISLKAALDGASGLAIGNVVGSNITNILLVMGIPALLAPTVCDEDGISRNLNMMIGFTLIFMVMLYHDELSRFDGFALLMLLGLYLYSQVRIARQKKAQGIKEVEADYHDEVSTVPTSNLVIGALLAIGIVLLPLGAELTVTGARSIAQDWGISDAVIGLTVVALGTSLPELATAIVATLRGNTSLAVGNVVGSNIFNIGSIMGITALVQPMEVDASILRVDIWIMLACALLLAGLAHWKVKLGKLVGFVLTGLYAIYITIQFAG